MKYHSPLKRILEQTRSHWDYDGMRPEVRTSFQKVLQCRTPALGAEVFGSESSELIVYHTCKSRACSTCGHWSTIKWQHARLAALPPVLYKGITFTMPDVLWRVFRDNRSLADALPALAAGAIEALTLAKHGLRTGVIAILHTFNGRLEFNAHVHTMVLAGGLRASSGSWVPRAYYDINLLTKLWRRAVLNLIREAHKAGLLKTDMTSDELKAMLAAQERWWSVKIQSFSSTQHFLQYAGRYARRPPIAQGRITYIGKRNVTFWAKDKKLKRLVYIRRSLTDFVDNWAQHIPKSYQHSVRYFGLLAPRVVSQASALILVSIGQKRKTRPKPLLWADSLRQTFKRDPLLDKTGQRMHWVRRIAPATSC